MKEIIARDYFISKSERILNSVGFKLVKNDNAMDFHKIFEGGYHQIHLLPTFYGGHAELGFSFYIRFDAINVITNKFLNVVESGYDTNPTFGFNLGLIGVENVNSIVNTQRETEALTKTLIHNLQNKVFPFFEKFSKMSAVDLEFNREGRQPNLFLHDSFDRPVIGLTAAALNHNPKFEYWESYYRDRLKKSSEARKKNFEELVGYLKKNLVSP